MKNKFLFAIFLMLSATVAKAQSSDHKMTETQKADAAKADVFINKFGKKITDSFTVPGRDSAAIKKSKKSCLNSNKKNS